MESCNTHLRAISQEMVSIYIYTSIHETILMTVCFKHDDAIKWKHFPRYWPFVRGIDRSPGNSPHKSQWRRALMFSLISAWINGWVINREAGDLRRRCTHYDVIVMNLQPQFTGPIIRCNKPLSETMLSSAHACATKTKGAELNQFG